MYLSLAELYKSLREAHKQSGQTDNVIKFDGEADALTLDIIEHPGPLETLPTFYDLNPELPKTS